MNEDQKDYGWFFFKDNWYRVSMSRGFLLRLKMSFMRSFSRVSILSNMVNLDLDARGRVLQIVW